MTERQQELLKYICEYKQAYGVPPFQKEMAKALKTSMGSITWLLLKLEMAGAIERGRGYRSLKICEPQQVNAA